MRSGRILQIFVSPIVTACMWVNHPPPPPPRPTSQLFAGVSIRRSCPEHESELARPATSCYPNRIRAGCQLARVDSDRDHSTISATSSFRLSCSIDFFFPLSFFCVCPSFLFRSLVRFFFHFVTNFTRVTRHVFAERAATISVGTSNKIGRNSTFLLDFVP